MDLTALGLVAADLVTLDSYYTAGVGVAFATALGAGASTNFDPFPGGVSNGDFRAQFSSENHIGHQYETDDNGGGGIFPTGTDCDDFLNDTPQLPFAQYGTRTKAGQVVIGNDVNPGAFFFFGKVTLSAGTHTIDVVQVSSPAGYEFDAKRNTVQLLDVSCNSLRITKTASGGNAQIVTGNLAAGDYIVRVQYSAGSIAGLPVAPLLPSGIATYVFQAKEGATVLAETTDFELQPKP